MPDPASPPGHPIGQRAIALWLLILCAMVFVMVVLGGLTRLTHSGLSMVEWRPITGWLPPLNDAQWQQAFDHYRRFPEYRAYNSGMTVEEFMEIFWLEYLHRLWGRLMGLAFLIPFVVFCVRGWVDRRLGIQLMGAFVLGGLQGALGWYMVASGLVDRPDVSQYRLTAHFLAALAIYGYMLWLALTLLLPRTEPAEGADRLYRGSLAVTALALLTMVSGGFVAGLDAGFAYNTFPLMDGEILPDAAYSLSPWYINLFEDITTVQFNHRILATATVVAVAVFWLASRRAMLSKRTRIAAIHLMALVLIQAGLGIATLLMQVPVALGSLHQVGAILLFSVALWTVFELRQATRD